MNKHEGFQPLFWILLAAVVLWGVIIGVGWYFLFGG